MTTFFYDSYAIIEFLNNNEKFTPYFVEHTGIITLLNLLEVYYSVLNEEGEEKANVVLQTLFPLIVQPNQNTIKNAMKFRQLHKKRNLSYADCLGYQVAKEKEIKFLTGDKEFKNLDNVEFVQ